MHPCNSQPITPICVPLHLLMTRLCPASLFSSSFFSFSHQIRLQIWPRVAGFGITASPLITQLCELIGLSDVTVKVTGRRKNIRNVVNAFVEALSGQSLPHDGVEGTGVYMREVYHAKTLPCGLKRGVDVP